MTDPKISIHNLNCFYADRQVVFDLSLDISANQILSVFGPSNSGVTTTLRSLNRLNELKPEFHMTGQIMLDGVNITAPEVSLTELRRRVGMVFDVPTPLPGSIFENVAYGLRLTGRKKAQISTAVEEALQLAALWDDVKDRLNQPAMSLSGGQQQRLCIARVLALQPEVIMLDRPCSGLDPISTARIEESLLQLKQNFTIILAPHNVQQALRVSDRVAFLLMGELVEEGLCDEVFANPADQRTADYITGRFG